MRDEFEDIVRNESQKLYGLSFRLTGNHQEAEDLCQESLARALRYYHRFEGRAQVSTWLYRIVMNTWKNKLRTKRKLTFFGFFRSEESADSDDQPTFLEPKSAEPPPETDMEREESEKILQQALLTMSKEEREIIVLRDLEDKSYEEIMEILELPMGTVKSRLARARESLRLKLAPILKSKGELS